VGTKLGATAGLEVGLAVGTEVLDVAAIPDSLTTPINACLVTQAGSRKSPEAPDVDSVTSRVVPVQEALN
jgi:hypothetical protein